MTERLKGVKARKLRGLAHPFPSPVFHNFKGRVCASPTIENGCFFPPEKIRKMDRVRLGIRLVSFWNHSYDFTRGDIQTYIKNKCGISLQEGIASDLDGLKVLFALWGGISHYGIKI